jgi:hypothetical protein
MFLFAMLVLLAYSFALSADNADRGKALFNDTRLGNNTSRMSCNSGHSNGSGLENAGDRKDLIQYVNSFIKNTRKGEPIDPMSQDMKDIVAYIKSLNGK